MLRGLERMAKKAFERGVDLALHTHANHAQQVTPLVGQATKRLLEIGFGTSAIRACCSGASTRPRQDLLDLCFMLLDHAKILPYYFYMCDMIPNSEHWRLASWRRSSCSTTSWAICLASPTPRIVCDVPFVGKRWVHQVAEYDRESGISYWTKNYRTGIEQDVTDALGRKYEYYDPISLLPASGQAWWREAGAAGAA